MLKCEDERGTVHLVVSVSPTGTAETFCGGIGEAGNMVKSREKVSCPACIKVRGKNTQGWMRPEDLIPGDRFLDPWKGCPRVVDEDGVSMRALRPLVRVAVELPGSEGCYLNLPRESHVKLVLGVPK